MATLPIHDTKTNRTVVLDFNGGMQVYHNPELGLIIPAQIKPGEFSAARRSGLVSTLNREYASQGVLFTIDAMPGASAVHIGRTDAFDGCGCFAGLAEGIGSGDAFVLLDASSDDAELVAVISHEAGHILGMLDHGGSGLARYGWHKDHTTYSGTVNPDYSSYLAFEVKRTTTYTWLTAPSDAGSLWVEYHEGGTENDHEYRIEVGRPNAGIHRWRQQRHGEGRCGEQDHAEIR